MRDDNDVDDLQVYGNMLYFSRRECLILNNFECSKGLERLGTQIKKIISVRIFIGGPEVLGLMNK